MDSYITMFTYRQLEQKIETLTKKRQAVYGQHQNFVKDMKVKIENKNQLEDKIRKANTARTQIRRHLEEMKASAEPEVQNIQHLVSSMFVLITVSILMISRLLHM